MWRQFAVNQFRIEQTAFHSNVAQRFLCSQAVTRSEGIVVLVKDYSNKLKRHIDPENRKKSYSSRAPNMIESQWDTSLTWYLEVRWVLRCRTHLTSWMQKRTGKSYRYASSTGQLATGAEVLSPRKWFHGFRAQAIRLTTQIELLQRRSSGAYLPNIT